MEFTRIANFKPNVGRVGLGTWATGGGTDEKAAIATIHRALDMGINLIDTAPVYGFGKSEEIVGKAIKQYGKREQICIATKVGLAWETKQLIRNSSQARINKEIKDSLKRLQVDYIDLYQVHWPDTATPIEETAKALKALLDDGIIRAIGVSNYSVEQMKAFQEIAPLHACQPPFNLFESEAAMDIVPYCLKKNIATLGYGTLCRGLLSGKMQKKTQFQGDDLRKMDPKFQEPRYSEYLHCVDRLQEWAEQKYKRSVLSLAARWVLDRGISVALWGARRPEQLAAIYTIWDWKLTKADFEEIDAILNECISSPLTPEFMAPPTR